MSGYGCLPCVFTPRRLLLTHFTMFFQGLPKDGYDYNQHIRPIRPGGMYLTPKGEVIPTEVVPGVAPTAIIPAEALPSEKMVERMLESIVIKEGRTLCWRAISLVPRLQLLFLVCRPSS